MAFDNYTTLSGIDEISSQSNINDTPFPRDNEIPEQIFGNICEDIQRITREIGEEIRKEPRFRNSETTETNMEKTVVVPELTALLEKKISIINQLTAQVKDSKLYDYPRFRGEATMSIPVMMGEETNSCQRAVELLTRINTNNEEYLKSLHESKQFCEEMETDDSGVDMTGELLDKISAEVNKDFVQCKKFTETLIDLLFPNTDYMDILGGLFEKAREGNWYEVSDKSDYGILLRMKQIHLVIENPDNVLQYKLNL